MNVELILNSMQISKKGIDLIKLHEGCVLHSYFCASGILTVGVGHTGADVKPGMTITQAEADRLLREDLKRFEDGVNELVKVPINQPQFDALVSLSFNIGLGALEGSTLLELLNQRKYASAGAEFKNWNKAGGRVLEGLIKRRREEEKLWYSRRFPTGAQ